MPTRVRAIRWTMAAIAVALAAQLAGPPSLAQQTLEVPPPAGQNAPPTYKPKPKRKPREQVVPKQEMEIAPEATQEAEPEPSPPPPPPLALPPPPAQEPLPAIFRGCWAGMVPFVDMIQRLPGAAPVGPWTAKSYRLCYRRVGSGPFELTFTDTGVAPHRLIRNPEGRLDVVSTDGQSYAQMQAHLRFDERYVRFGFGRGSFEVNETTNLECHIDRNAMYVRASVTGAKDGEPWFHANWHATFMHIPD